MILYTYFRIEENKTVESRDMSTLLLTLANLNHIPLDKEPFLQVTLIIISYARRSRSFFCICSSWWLSVLMPNFGMMIPLATQNHCQKGIKNLINTILYYIFLFIINLIILIFRMIWLHVISEAYLWFRLWIQLYLFIEVIMA